MNTKKILSKVKKIELDVLDVIHNVCVENNLKYSLAYGTLLGAVRHGGFIPWDDDIDIYMPRDDYEKLMKILSENPIEGYVLLKLEKDNDYINCFAKLKKDNTTFLQPKEEKYKYHKGIFIDIFPCDFKAESKIGQILQRADVLLKTLYARSYVPENSGGVIKAICKLLLLIVPRKRHHQVSLFFENRFIKRGRDNQGYLETSILEAMQWILPNDIFDNLELIGFEDRKYYAIKNWDDNLKMVYGDYMKLPPEEKRISQHAPILIDLEHNYEDISA